MTDVRVLDRLILALRELAVLIPERDRDVIGFDLETTGLNPEQDVVLELGLARLAPSGEVTTHEVLFNPQRPVSAKILELTGLTQADLDAADPWTPQHAEIIAAGFAGCDFLGFNVKHFDLQFLRAQCRKVNVDFSYEAARIIDASVLWKMVERRTLADFVSRFAGRPHDGAHRAIADVAGTAEGLIGFLRTFPNVPRTVQGIHDLSFPRDSNWADREGKLAWSDGALRINFGTARRGQDVLALSRDRAFKGGRSYLEWVLRADFPEDTKSVLRDLLYGEKLPPAPAAPAAPVPSDAPF